MYYTDILLILIGIILAYTYCYFIFPDNITILQCSLDEFDFPYLYRRQPLVIEDYIANVSNIIQIWFSSNIVQNVTLQPKQLWNLNCHKYLYVYAQHDTEILLYGPGKKVENDTPDNSEPVVSIQLKKAQSLIVPYRWYYNIDLDNVQLYGIHDYITYGVDMCV